MVYSKITELSTARLKLRKLKISNAPEFFKFGGDPVVSKYMHWKPHQALADSEKSIRTSLLRYDTEPYYRWGIALNESDKLIGMIQLLGFDNTTSSCSFAYMLRQDYWGMGYGPEALKAVFEFAFSQLQVQKIVADHFSPNLSSGAAMKKAGMAYVKTIPEKYEKDGIRYDAEQYVMIAPEQG